MYGLYELLERSESRRTRQDSARAVEKNADKTEFCVQNVPKIIQKRRTIANSFVTKVRKIELTRMLPDRAN